MAASHERDAIEPEEHRAVIPRDLGVVWRQAVRALEERQRGGVVAAACGGERGEEVCLGMDGVALERRSPPGHGLYTRLCGAPPPSAEVVEQIELDVVRTNVGEGEAGEGEAEARRAALRRVLLAWAR